MVASLYSQGNTGQRGLSSPGKRRERGDIMALGIPSGCWKGVTHGARAEEGGDTVRFRRILKPPTREEYSAPDVVMGLGVDLDIGIEEGSLSGGTQ